MTDEEKIKYVVQVVKEKEKVKVDYKLKLTGKAYNL
jgi:hypothetical protein